TKANPTPIKRAPVTSSARALAAALCTSKNTKMSWAINEALNGEVAPPRIMGVRKNPIDITYTRTELAKRLGSDNGRMMLRIVRHGDAPRLRDASTSPRSRE